MLKLTKLKRDQNGNGILLCIFILFFMLGVGGLVVDTSILYKEKGEMRKAANAAVLSGVQVIFEKDDSIKNVVSGILTANNEPYDEENLQINRTENKLTYTLPKTVPLYFMKIFGIPSFNLVVTSSAKSGPLGTAGGAVPIGLPDDSNFEIGKSYPLNFNPGEGERGNFEYLDFSNVFMSNGTKVVDPGGSSSSGAGTLGFYLLNGFGQDIGVNYHVLTETGINYGKVSEAIESRINSKNPDDRILLVLLYSTDTNDVNETLTGKTNLKITGFACFYLEGIQGKEITGEFIKKVEVGSVDDGALDKGAYAIKLVE